MMNEPQDKHILDYSPPPAPPSVGSTLLGLFAGMGGYVLLAVGCNRLLVFPQFGWLNVLLTTLPPLVIMVVLSVLFKSRAMLLSSLIMFGMAVLSCGTCVALMSMLR
jgi:hypothetical protein